MIAKLSYWSKRIREFRKKKGLTQINIADKLCLSQSAYAKIENGHTALDIHRLMEIAKLLEVPISDFLPRVKAKSYQFNPKNESQKLKVEHFYVDGRVLLKVKDKLIKTKNNRIKHLEKEVEFLRNQLK